MKRLFALGFLTFSFMASAATTKCAELQFALDENDFSKIPVLVIKDAQGATLGATEIIPLNAGVDQSLTNAPAGTRVCVTGRKNSSSLNKFFAYQVELKSF